MFDWLGSVFCVVVGVLMFALLSLELPLAPAATFVASDWAPGLSDVCIYFGIRIEFNVGCIWSSCSVKLNRGGSSRPFGNLVPCSLNSLKKEWAQACNGVILNDGVYSKSRATSSIASGGVRALNTCKTHKTWSENRLRKITKSSSSTWNKTYQHITPTLFDRVRFRPRIFQLHWYFHINNVSVYLNLSILFINV